MSDSIIPRPTSTSQLPSHPQSTLPRNRVRSDQAASGVKPASLGVDASPPLRSINDLHVGGQRNLQINGNGDASGKFNMNKTMEEYGDAAGGPSASASAGVVGVGGSKVPAFLNKLFR